MTQANAEPNRTNWIDHPQNCVGFVRVEELTTVASIATTRGASPWAADVRGLGELDRGTRRLLTKTHTNALVVVRDGSIVHEWYARQMSRRDTHILMSLSKSLTSLLCGVLVGQGLVDVDDEVVGHVRELRGTAWDGCTVQHLLDMRTGVAWDYDRDEADIFDVSDYRHHSRDELPDGTMDWIRTIDRAREPGRAFEYVSLVSDVLALVLASAGGRPYPELMSELLWKPLGAESDASIIVDRYGFPIAEGGISATARDVARVGVMMLNDGRAGNQQVVPSDWVGRLREPDAQLIKAFQASAEADTAHAQAFYHDSWWIRDAEEGVYSGLGVFGQVLRVDHATGTVAVKLSSQPAMEDPQMVACDAELVDKICAGN